MELHQRDAQIGKGTNYIGTGSRRSGWHQHRAAAASHVLAGRCKAGAASEKHTTTGTSMQIQFKLSWNGQREGRQRSALRCNPQFQREQAVDSRFPAPPSQQCGPIPRPALALHPSAPNRPQPLRGAPFPFTSAAWRGWPAARRPPGQTRGRPQCRAPPAWEQPPPGSCRSSRPPQLCLCRQAS